jgi:hypothetical protein
LALLPNLMALYDAIRSHFGIYAGIIKVEDITSFRKQD